MYNVANVSFSFKFSETATSKVHKQYDPYAQYWLKKQSLGQNHFCWSLFAGHCKNEDFLKHFEHFVTEMQCDKSFLLHLGIYGPKVNSVFQKRLQSHFLIQNSTFLDAGTCPLHTIHNRFSKVVSMIDFYIEQFIVDINAFLNYFVLTERIIGNSRKLLSCLHIFLWNVPPHDGSRGKKSLFEFLSSGKT